MNFVIPMAGLGSRFAQSGYGLPKMLIKAHGKTLLEWSLSSLPLHLASTVVFTGLKMHEDEFSLSSKIKNLYPTLNCKFIFLDGITRGQAETVYLSLPACNSQEPLVIFNIDTYFNSTTLEDQLKSTDNDGVLGYFDSSENRFSFARLGVDSRYVTEVREKEVISSYALTGLYTFRQIEDFKETYEYHEKNNLTTKGEYYIAPMYNYLILAGKKYVLDKADKHFILGTPDEYEQFLNETDFE
jgi:dTDP-glucose pyrophosphorylase